MARTLRCELDVDVLAASSGHKGSGGKGCSNGGRKGCGGGRKGGNGGKTGRKAGGRNSGGA